MGAETGCSIPCDDPWRDPNPVGGKLVFRRVLVVRNSSYFLSGARAKEGECVGAAEKLNESGKEMVFVLLCQVP